MNLIIHRGADQIGAHLLLLLPELNNGLAAYKAARAFSAKAAPRVARPYSLPGILV